MTKKSKNPDLVINNVREFFKNNPDDLYTESEVAKAINHTVTGTRIALKTLANQNILLMHGISPSRYSLCHDKLLHSNIKEVYKPGPEPYRRNDGYPNPNPRKLLISKVSY